MPKFLPFLIIGLIISVTSFAQQKRVIGGSVVDSAGIPLTDVYVKLVSGKDSVTTTTAAGGTFRFTNIGFPEFTLSASMIGYETYNKSYTITANDNKTFNVGALKLTIQDNRLADVVVVAVNPITVKEDTIEYKASAYKVREGAPVEDVLKKLPGVTVDKDGNVTAQGKAVARVRVNGKDYFGGDVQTATQNLPADIIDNIQIIDDYGDRANITGVKDGEPEKILNINVQRGKNKGNFGNSLVGVGNENRYVARVAANNFNEDRQISFLGALNNTNANIFNFNGGGRGGGARGANLGSGDRGGGGDGITVSRSLGINFRDKIGKKISTYGSYSFSSRSSNVVGTSFQQDFNPNNIRTTSRNSNSTNSSSNHRVTWNVEYNIDSANYIKITPFLSYGSSIGSSNSISEITQQKLYTLNNSIGSSRSTSPSGGSDFLFNHKFQKRGRNFSVSSTINYSESIQDRDADNKYHDVDFNNIATDSARVQFIGSESRNTNKNVRISYAEPLSKSTSVELSYTWNNSSTESVRNVDDIDPLLGGKTRNIQQSNDYNYQFTTNRYGLNLRTFKTKYNYVIGAVAQPSTLRGNDLGRKNTTTKRNFNIIPTARFVYNFARSNNLTVTVGGASREPNFMQLQPISDSSNLRNIINGNPELRAELTNRLAVQYNKVGILTGNSFFANFSYDRTQNKIVTARFNDPRSTRRTTTYLNTNGFYGFDGNLSYSKPFAERKFTATVSTSGSFDNNISYTNNQRNKGQNWVLRPGARFRLDLQDKVDLDLNSTYVINRTVTRFFDTTSKTSVTQTKTLTFGLNGKNYFFKNWTLGYDVNKIINYGFLNTKNSNPTLINMYVERRFLKNNKATVRLQGFDLLNQNTGISREVNGTTVTDVQNNRLARYFLLTFNLRLQKFTGSRSSFQRNGEGRPGGGMRNGGGGGNGGGGNGGGGSRGN